MESSLDIRTTLGKVCFCLDHKGQLNAWEKEFLGDIAQENFVSRRQEAKVAEIFTKLLLNRKVADRYLARLRKMDGSPVKSGEAKPKETTTVDSAISANNREAK